MPVSVPRLRLRYVRPPSTHDAANLALRRIAAGIAVSLGLSVSGGDASPFRRIAASEPAPKEADSVAAIVAEYVDALISDRHLYSESGVYPGPSFWEAPNGVPLSESLSVRSTSAQVSRLLSQRFSGILSPLLRLRMCG